jgi:beta-fructofuranosidase
MHWLRLAVAIDSLLLAIAPLSRSAATDASPFADAVAVWHMADTSGRVAERARLTIHDSVSLGVDLVGPERSASLRRGGDGRVAEFDGGYLIAGEEAAEPLHLRGDKMTFCIRLRDPAGKWDAPLFARHAANDQFGKILHVAPLNTHVIGYSQSRRIRAGQGIEFVWRTTPLKERVRPEYFEQGDPPNLLRFHTEWEAKHTPARKGDFLNGLLRLHAPTDLIGPDRWHDIVIRFNRVKLELFVDGVLLDEDWPHGNLHGFTGPFLIGAGFQGGKLLRGFHGQIDHVAIWDRALGDDEVRSLSGGPEEAARRDVEILGARQPIGQYWRPHGYNTSIGDCMTFTHDGRFHVFFLSDRRHGGSKWGLQALPWGHISSKDLVHWEEHPCPLDITEPWECCLGTGSFAHHDGRSYLFYIKHDRRAWFKDNPNFGDAIFVATSDDGIHFNKRSSPLMVPGFFNENDINSDIYPDKTNGGFILSLSNWKVFKSRDLEHWQPRTNLTTPQWWPCTSYFEWNDQYYFTSCGLHWTSQTPIEDPTTKWEGPPHQTLNDGIRVAQVASFKNRYLMVGFTPEPPHTYYGGELLIRELVQNPDGTLGTKWPAEMIPKSGAALNLPSRALVGDVSADTGTIRVSAPEGLAVGTLDKVPQDVRITLRVKPRAGTQHFGLCVRGQGNYMSGCELQFEPARQHVQFAPVSDGRIAKTPDNWMAIGGVTGIDRPFTLDVIVKDDLVDACIDNRRTIITRNRTRLSGDRLSFFVDHGEVTFEKIQVRPLLKE